jgi:DNA gyrase subunit A
VHEIPSVARIAKGKPLVNLIQIAPGDKVHAVVPVRAFRPDHYLMLATSRGIIKKTPLEEFSRPRRAGIRAITLEDGERLVSATETDGTRDVVLATSAGMAIRFNEQEIRPMGRSARGVRGIQVAAADEVIGMVIVHAGGTLLTIAENGFGKRSPLEDYRLQHRGGRGLITIKTSERNGRLVEIKEVADDEELIVITRAGISIRLAVGDISTIGRNTQGVRIISLGEGDLVGGVAKLAGNGPPRIDGVDGGGADAPDAAAAGAVQDSGSADVAGGAEGGTDPAEEPGQAPTAP